MILPRPIQIQKVIHRLDSSGLQVLVAGLFSSTLCMFQCCLQFLLIQGDSIIVNCFYSGQNRDGVTLVGIRRHLTSQFCVDLV